MSSKTAKLCIFLGLFEVLVAVKYWVNGPDPNELQVINIVNESERRLRQHWIYYGVL